MKSPLHLLLLFALGPLLLGAAEVKRPRILGISHAAFRVTDMAKARAFYEDFLGYASPFSIPRQTGGEMVWIKINDRQTVELFTGPEVEAAADELYHIALETDDAEAMRLYLAARGVAVPDHATIGKIGNKNYFIKDPNGNTLEIVEYLPASWMRRDQGKFLPATGISARIRHVGAIVGQLDASLKFYGDILGFKETWRGSADGRTLSWVNLQVPDGDDYIEFMLYDKPPALERRRRMDHICLEVDDVARAGEILKGRPLPAGNQPPSEMRTGINGKRQINCFDPDGWRAELMEPETFDGRPVPPSSAPPPAPIAP